jgi:hypothetical protein
MPKSERNEVEELECLYALPDRDTTHTHPNDSALVFRKHAFGALSNTTQGQFGNFRSHFKEADFWGTFTFIKLPNAQNCHYCWKSSSEFHRTGYLNQWTARRIPS